MGWKVFGCVFIGLMLKVAVQSACASVVKESSEFLCTTGGEFLALAVVAVALITFFGFLQYGTYPEDMRRAITVALVTVYLVLVSLVAFFTNIKRGTVELDPLTQAMITSFTAIVAIVIPSYFGATAYVQVSEARANRKEVEGEREDELHRKQEDTYTEPAGASETPTEQPGRIGPQTPLEGSQEPIERRSWWRKDVRCLSCGSVVWLEELSSSCSLQ